jgi:hypothetical protein
MLVWRMDTFNAQELISIPFFISSPVTIVVEANVINILASEFLFPE